MNAPLTPDICVVGGGPAGIAAALAVVREGGSVVLVEMSDFGGVYHREAVKARALAAAAATRETLRQAPAMGMSVAPIQVNLAKVREGVDQVAAEAGAVVRPERLKALGVDVLRGAAAFTDRRTLQVGETSIRAARFVLAVGATRPPPGIAGIEDIDCLTAANPADLGRKPTHVVVLGAGPTALEMAQSYQRLGIDASVIATGQMLAGFDREQVDIVAERLRGEGVRLRAGYVVESVQKRRGSLRLTLGEPGRKDAPATTVDASHLFIAGGRHPRVDGLGLREAGIDHGPDGIAVDARLRTTNPRVFAVGDCIAGPATAARASAQALSVVARLMGRSGARPDSLSAVRTVHTDPAIAAVGLGEDDARARGEKVRALRTAFAETLQAGIERRPHGYLKVVVSENGRVLGASAVGHGALEVLTPWSLAISRRLDVDAMASLSVPTPSLSEVTPLAAAIRRDPGRAPGWGTGLRRFLGTFG